jgi:hypothetical protein
MDSRVPEPPAFNTAALAAASITAQLVTSIEFTFVSKPVSE